MSAFRQRGARPLGGSVGGSGYGRERTPHRGSWRADPYGGRPGSVAGGPDPGGSGCYLMHAQTLQDGAAVVGSIHQQILRAPLDSDLGASGHEGAVDPATTPSGQGRATPQ